MSLSKINIRRKPLLAISFLVFVFVFVFVPAMLVSCSENPIDEDGLLITNRSECYVSNFDIAGTDRVSVRVGSADIDTLECTVRVTVQYGTDLKHVYPQFTLVTDAKLEPKITGMEDYSDLDHPKQYTVVSGNRKVRKTYTVYVTPQTKQ